MEFGNRTFVATGPFPPLTIKERRSGKKTTVTSLADAIKMLWQIGIEPFWASIADNREFGQVFTFQGGLSRTTLRRQVRLPFKEDDPEFAAKIQALLEQLFRPFQIQGTLCYRSVVTVKDVCDVYHYPKRLDLHEDQYVVHLTILLQSGLGLDAQAVVEKTLQEITKSPIEPTRVVTFRLN